MLRYNRVNEDKQVIESKVDQKEWILECERVAPKLKITTKSEGKEWRAHIEQTRTYSENIKKILPHARENLEKMSDDLGKVLERIIKREKNINVNMTEKVRKSVMI
jgi:estrogen-related receptor beta like 1